MSNMPLIAAVVVLLLVLVTAVQDLLDQDFSPVRHDVQEWDLHVKQALYVANENRQKDVM